MRILASIILGAATGWALIHASDFMPSQVQQLIGNSVAASETIKNLTEFIFTEGTASRSLHWWILAFSISAIPLIFIASISTLASQLTGKPRAFIYSSLIYPVSMSAGAFYAAQKVFKINPLHGTHLLASASQQASLYILDITSFLVFFYLISYFWKRA